jgi:hypothetical protein
VLPGIPVELLNLKNRFPLLKTYRFAVKQNRYRFWLPLRVVTCLLEFYHDCAMTRIGYAKPQAFVALEALTQSPNHNG